MSAVPRIALDARAQTMFGIVDPLPMYDPEFVRLVRETIALAYGASALDCAHWDMLRVHVAESVDCGVCRNMRDIKADVTASHDPAASALRQLGDRFHSPTPEVEDEGWRALHATLSDEAIAEALLGPVFGSFHPKVMIVCGLEPADSFELTNTTFDASRYSVETGAIGMVLGDDDSELEQP